MKPSSASLAPASRRRATVSNPHLPVPSSGAPRTRRRNLAPLLMLSPAGVVLVAVTLIPIGFLIWTSFTDFSQRTLFTGAYSIVGLQQYATLLTDSEFWAAVLRTLLFTTAMVVGSVVIGMAVSHLLTRLGRFWRYTTTVVLILAWGMPNVASSLVWVWLFQPGYGVVNWAIARLHIFGDTTNLDWSHDAGRAFVCIWMLIVWQAVPFIALTLNAAETQVPAEIRESARLDGAGELRVYRSVTLVYLRPTLMLVTILSVIWDYNAFNQIWLVSRGGPGNSTSTLGVFTYKEAFVGFQIGHGAAVSVVTTVLLLAVTALYIRSLLRSGEDL